MLQTIRTTKKYTASFSNEIGLVVEKVGKCSGVQLQPSHPQCAQYIEAMQNAFDDEDFNNLCRAVL